ncbi:MAG TPA: ribbon-helix-helix protein, CopG family [Gemmatimonadaceae bacterium]|nr:ribbon-helix-helix protein, CopG family [Gemmatimonadaceae bacterium]
MAKRHEKRDRVAEPVQVYLAQDDRETLRRLANQLSLSMSDVIRRAICALEESVRHPQHHPALRLIGIAEGEAATPLPYDAAAEHDRVLADVADPAARAPTAAKRTRRSGR